MFANRNIYSKLNKNKTTPDIPKIGNGLVQLIRMDGFTRQMWVKEITPVDSDILPGSTLTMRILALRSNSS